MSCLLLRSVIRSICAEEELQPQLADADMWKHLLRFEGIWENRIWEMEEEIVESDNVDVEEDDSNCTVEFEQKQEILSKEVATTTDDMVTLEPQKEDNVIIETKIPPPPPPKAPKPLPPKIEPADASGDELMSVLTELEVIEQRFGRYYRIIGNNEEPEPPVPTKPLKIPPASLESWVEASQNLLKSPPIVPKLKDTSDDDDDDDASSIEDFLRALSMQKKGPQKVLKSKHQVATENARKELRSELVDKLMNQLDSDQALTYLWKRQKRKNLDDFVPKNASIAMASAMAESVMWKRMVNPMTREPFYVHIVTGETITKKRDGRNEELKKVLFMNDVDHDDDDNDSDVDRRSSSVEHSPKFRVVKSPNLAKKMEEEEQARLSIRERVKHRIERIQKLHQ